MQLLTEKRWGPAAIRANASAACLAAGLCFSLAGCKQAAPASDATLALAVQTQLAADSALNGQPVQASVQGGVATLNGTVSNSAEKTIAGRDAAGVQGVREVMNNLSIGSAPGVVTAMAPAPVPLPAPVQRTPALVKPSAATSPARIDRRALPQARVPAPVERDNQAGGNAVATPSYSSLNTPPPPPPAPAPPAFRNVTVSAGSTIPVRVTETLDSATTQQGAAFSGVVASDVVVEGMVAIPAGSAVSGHVDAVQEAAHYKGASLLTVSLSSVTRRGEHIGLSTDPYSVEGKARGKNTAEKVGGGAAVGAILGGIFGGGKGAGIGAAAGGGLGAGANTITRGEQVQIPSESVVRFHLASPLSLRVRVDAGGHSADPGLQQHPPQS